MPATRQTRMRSPLQRSAKPALLRRLSRVEGQIRGIARMFEKDRYCVDVLIQIVAVRSALDAIAKGLLRDHAHHCVQAAVKTGRGTAAIDELLRVVDAFSP